MSNAIVPINSNALATAQAAFGDADFTGQVAQSSLHRISIKGGVFRRHAGKQEIDSIDARSLEVVIVAAAPAVHREFYEGKYQEGVEAVPVCWSSNGVAPDKGVTKPQHTNCNDCPKNAKGSGDGTARACRFAQRIGVVLANDIGGPVYAMKLPAMSTFGEAKDGYYPFKPYMTYLKANKVPAPSIVTEMRFDTSAAVPKLMFRPRQGVAYIGDENIETIKQQMASEDAKREIELKVVVKKEDAEVAKPALVEPAPAKAAKPRTAEPVAPSVPAGAASAMAAAMQEWDADE
jgi:hypothetical protein